MVKQIAERGHGACEVAKRLEVSHKSLYVSIKQAREQERGSDAYGMLVLKAELARIKAELKRTTEKRDLLKKAVTYFAKVPG